MGNYHNACMISFGVVPASFPNSILHRLNMCRKPNATRQARPKAGAQRTLEGSPARACSAPTGGADLEKQFLILLPCVCMPT